MNTIVPHSELLAYYGNRLVFIDNGIHKVCIVDHKDILGLGLSNESYKSFWMSCYRNYLRLTSKQTRERIERDLENDKINALGRMKSKYYDKLNQG